jgi:uncharacterized protein with PIN domain
MLFAKRKPTFMVDHMLIKLGKYLRILGYDAAWDEALRTHELIARANAEERTFLTRNTRLPDEYPVPAHWLAVTPTEPDKQLAEVIASSRLDSERYLFSRCVRCNVELADVKDKSEIREKVHANVYERYDRFYTCPACGTVFWKGTHVRNTCAKLGIPVPA